MPLTAEPDQRHSAAEPVRQDDVSQGEIRWAVLGLAWPSILENLLQSVLGLVTLFMVGQIGAAEVAAVGASQQVQILFISGFFALSMGTTVLVAHAYGAGRLDSMATIAKQSLLAGTLLAFVFTAVVAIFARPMIAVLGAEPDVVDEAASFMRWTAPSFLFLAVTFILGGVLRGTGDARTPLVVTIVMNVLNVAIAYPLIFGQFGMPRLEVTGAALGMVASRGIGFLIIVFLLASGRRGVSIGGRSGWLPDISLLRRLADIGLPSMAESLLRTGGQLLYVVIVFMLGTAVTASYQIAQNAMFLSLFPGFGFAMATTALVGQSLGAGNQTRARAVTMTATRACLVWMSVMGVLFFVFAGPIMELGATGADRDEIVNEGIGALRMIALAQPFQAVGFVLAGALRGAGDTRWPMYSTAISMWVFRLPLAYLLAITLDLSLVGIFLAMTIDTIVLMMMNIWRWRQGKWTEKRLLGDARPQAVNPALSPEPAAAND
jgi:putative MATE family efflux protein